MKKARIMLMTIAVIASVGTALAFKVKAKATDDYCYLTATQKPAVGDCTDQLINSTTSNKKFFTNGTAIYYTTKVGSSCSEESCDLQGGTIDVE